MKVSLNWAQNTSNIDITVIGAEEIVKKIGAQLGAVEDVVYWGERYNGAVVARVVSCEKHPNADKLHVCRVDDGGVTENVERGEDGFVQVVCGAPNVQQDLLVIWLPPGATVPTTINDAEPFVLSARELRGVISNGMLASANELGISEDHDGLLEVTVADVGEELAKPGTALKRLYGLDDVVIDCENKMFTHRPDCFGILGVARELAGIQNLAFKSPDWYLGTTKFKEVNDLPLVVDVQTGAVPRFMVVAVKDVNIAPSPLYMQAGLSRVGIRPINNVVDITNWLMHLTGQPLHAYDYDKVKSLSSGSPTLIARSLEDGQPEKLTLLNGKEVELKDNSDIVISTDSQVIGVGGVMGGASTEVDANTKNIILECANFDMYSIRRTSVRYGLFTDAVTRYTKGQSAHQNDSVIAQAIELVSQITGGTQASDVFDPRDSRLVHPDTFKPSKPVHVSAGFISERLGIEISAGKIAELLTNVEFDVSHEGDGLTVLAPFWRTDIALGEDIVEEIGRLHGYDKLPLALPMRSTKAAPIDKLLDIKSTVRTALSASGANELLTYSFVPGTLLSKAGQLPENSYQISNALSPELQYYRQTLTPSLLDKVRPNNKAGYSEFALFEIGKTHNKVHGLNDENVPGELEMIAFVYAVSGKAATAQKGAAFYQARAYLDALAGGLGLQFTYSAITDTPDYPVTAAFEPSRSAYVATDTGVFIGIIGEYKQSVITNFKLPNATAGFEIGTEHLLEATAKSPASYTPISKFPKVSQDISLTIPPNTSYGTVFGFLEAELQKQKPANTAATLEPLDIYKNNDDSHMAFRLTIASYERTLTAEEVNSLLDAIAGAAEQSLQLKRI